MIINEKITIRINNKNIDHYKKYNPKYGDIIIVDSIELKESSHQKVKYQCDICEKIFETSFRNYFRAINRPSSVPDLFGKSLCKKCTYIKCQQTILNKYGFISYSSTKEYKESIINKHGVENVSKLDSVKEKKKSTSMKKYGVECVLQSEEVKGKIKDTNIKKYGVDNPTKNREIFEKAQSTAYKKAPYDGTDIIYQGSYELHFINYCVGRGIKLENGPSIRYNMGGRDRMYHSDFYLPQYELICEIKSEYTLQDDYEENMLKKSAAISDGYKFLFIVDKIYSEFEKIIRDHEGIQNRI